MKLTNLLDISENSKVTLIGSGGKTTLSELLAKENQDKKVLIATTTKIGMPTNGTVLTSYAQAKAHSPHKGKQYLGASLGKKLASFPLEEIEELSASYDLVLMEGDGSMTLPLTAWADFEPVIPSFTTHTLAVVPAFALTLFATKQSVCRLPEFLSLTGLAEGQRVTAEGLTRLITSPTGLFEKSVGKKYLILNQADTEKETADALRIAEMVAASGFLLDGILIGSAHKQTWQRK